MRTMLLVISVIALAGCASPRYQSVYRYEPPADGAARGCLEKCSQKMESCQKSCTADYQACLTRIEPLVEGRYNEALKRYAGELEGYRWDLERYQLYQSLRWSDSFWYGPGFYRPWPGPYYTPIPIAPRKPSRDEAFKQLKKEKCEVECGCQPIYDACFLGCGGKMIPEERCVANCPEGK